MRALVTGGAGLIGSHLADLLIERGWDVISFDNLDAGTHAAGRPSWAFPFPPEPKYLHTMVSPGATYTGDVRNDDQLKYVMKGIDVVFHQAAFGGFSPDPRKMIETNALGTVKVLTAAAHAGVSKVVVASSQAVYGFGVYRCQLHGEFSPIGRSRSDGWDHRCPHCRARTWPVPLREDMLVQPSSIYAVSKYTAERVALGHRWPMPVVALRYALTYGPRQSVSNPYTGICSIFATRLRNGLSPVIYEDGAQTRDFTFVTDVAEANLLVATDPRADGRMFNVGRGIPITVEQFADTLCDAFGFSARELVRFPRLRGDWRPQDARHIYTDSAQLRALGWQSKVELRDGLRAYIDWFETQPQPPEVFTAAEDGLRRAGVVVSA